jgi:hypothetical protein
MGRSARRACLPVVDDPGAVNATPPADRHPGNRRRRPDGHDLEVRILSARGYDLIADAREFGREVIPLVRAEVARRDAAA